MLMALLWSFVEPIVAPIAGAIPAAPEPVALEVPWPAFLPTWPITASLVAVLAVGTAVLLVKVARWLYGLVPVVQ